jgi:predicted tellurium resistance membrane protein TerC
MENFMNADMLLALLSLTMMEIILGIDNIVFIAILVAKVPAKQRDKVRKIGIGLALITRLLLLFSIAWVMGLTSPLFEAFGKEVSGRDLILLAGGLFLIGKATYEIHDKLESGTEMHGDGRSTGSQIGSVLFQIILLDIIFSLDSVITAVGMTNQLPIMVAAMVIAVGVMLFASGSISDFVHKHPTIKILALSFLLLIGVMLFAEGTGVHIGKGYIYFAMAFSLSVELINMKYRKKHVPVKLHAPHE